MSKFLFGNPLSILCIIFLFTGCESIKQSSKYGFNEGFFKSRLFHKNLKSVYIIPGDTIKVYTKKGLQKTGADSITSLKFVFPADKKPGDFETYYFKQGSIDIDVLTILFKYRPSVSHFPPELNTSVLNGALYFGHRTDFFKISYKKTPFADRRKITHYACSFGLFTGIGASRIDEYVTRNKMDYEYDGIVNPSGIAAILAVDRFTCGLTFGVDHLLDKNHFVWIYNGKPWIGLSIGLNLN